MSHSSDLSPQEVRVRVLPLMRTLLSPTGPFTRKVDPGALADAIKDRALQPVQFFKNQADCDAFLALADAFKEVDEEGLHSFLNELITYLLLIGNLGITLQKPDTSDLDSEIAELRAENESLQKKLAAFKGD